MKIKLDPWQKEFLETEGDKILCCGRQIGKSEICAIDAANFALTHEKVKVLMIAPTERQAYELFTKTLGYLMDNYLKHIKQGKDRPTKSKITLKNNTQILCLPTGTSGTGIRGLTVARVYVDEASRVPEGIMSGVVQPMLLTTGGNMILLSTPHGAQGEFYDVFTNKDSVFDSFTRFSKNTEDVIKNREISSTWTDIQREQALVLVNRAKAQFSSQLFGQEYMGEFQDSLFRYFSDEMIQKCCILKREARNPGSDVYLGVDIARMGQDMSAFCILEKQADGLSKQIEQLVTKKTLTTETENKIIQLNNSYNFKKIAIDAGAGTLGVSVFDHLIEVPEIRRKLEAVNNAKRVYDREGKGAARLLKEDLYDNLRGMMQRSEIRLLDDDLIIESFRSIQFEYISEEGKSTKMKIFSTGSPEHGDIVESVIRAALYSKGKVLNMWIDSLNV